ncbi:MAG: TonB-dependent receptor [Niastella sp.]|nr:TonB-dependent receptor [Niastella sp.]
MRKILALAMGLLFLCSSLLAQNRTITGKVTDEKGTPIPNVSVLVKGTQVGTTTKSDGTYSIGVPASGKILVFSSIDLETKEVAIGSSATLNVSLADANKTMDQVVVVGYQAIRKKDVAGAISKISGSEIDNLPMPSFAQALQGRAAGVNITAANGIPGGTMNVRIRGVGSINAGNDPLYVVDGVQLNTSVGSINTQNNPLSFLNTDDIESIEILKDAAAASIYGARAANGVVLITTKKGLVGKTKYTASAYYGESSALKLVDPLTTQEWYKVRYEAVANANPNMTPAAIRTSVLSSLGVSTSLDDKGIDSLPTYDWQDASFHKGKITSVEATMQGGNQNVNYYLSGAYSKQTAIIQPTDFQRATLFSKISFKISKKLTLDNGISLSTFSQNAPYSTGNTGFGNPAYASSMMMPINPIYNPDGTYYGMPGSGQALVGSFNHNILAVADYITYFTRTNSLLANMSLTYNVLPELTLRTMAGLDYRLTQDERYQDPRINDAYAVKGRLSNQTDWNVNFITNTTANYRKTFAEDHSVNALLGIEFRKDQNQWFQADAQGFPSYQLRYLSAASTASSVSGQWNGNAAFSQFAKVGYTYRDKYILNYTVRRDGSSRFGTNNLYGVFQSVQLAWNAKEESFLANVDAISDLKVRYSFGQAGNDQIGNTQFRQLYGAARIYGNSSAINPTQLGNPDLSWETREEHNIGLDVAFLNGRVSLTADVYRKINKDLLLSRSLYATTGFSSITQNLGSVENKGLELLLIVKPVDGAFKWNSSFNISFQKNKVKELYDGLQALPGDATIRVGESLGSFYLAEWAGVNPATGRGMWYDKGGNITYNPLDADRKVVGNVYPTHYGGWTNTFSYKGLSLEAFLQYEYGRVRPDEQFQQMMRMGGTGVNTLKEGFYGRWQKPGDIVDVPRPVNGMAEINSVSWATGTRYYYKTDYVRLKTITLSYELPAKLIRKYSFEGIRVYVQGINLWTYTKWNGYDPEYTGSNTGTIPQSKNMTAGIQVRL